MAGPSGNDDGKGLSLSPNGSPENASGDLVARTAVVWKTALGSVVAWEVAKLTGSSHPYLAPLTLILCLQATVGQSLRFAWQRSVGTVIGVLIIGVFARDLPLTAWMLGAVLLVSTGIMKAIGLNDKVIHQIALSVLFVWYFEQHSPGYGWDRAKDTVLGALTAVLFVVFIAPPNPITNAARQLQQFVGSIGKMAKDEGQFLKHGYLSTGAWDAANELESLQKKFHQVATQVTQVTQSKQFNPYTDKNKSALVEQQFQVIRTAYLHFTELTFTLIEWVSNGEITQGEAAGWADALIELGRLADDVTVQMGTEGKAIGNVSVPNIPDPGYGQTTATMPYGLLAKYEAHRFIQSLQQIPVSRPKAH